MADQILVRAEADPCGQEAAGLMAALDAEILEIYPDLLAALEKAARGRGYQAIRLETGLKQPAAISLYESAGYQRIPCYGIFVSDPESRCFEKRLEAAGAMRE